MKNLLAANLVPVGKRFVAIKDQESNPGVVSLGQDSKLNLQTALGGSWERLSENFQPFDVHQDTALKL